MARESIDDEAAFEMLHRGSQNRNIKLREMAQELVRRTAQRAPD